MAWSNYGLYLSVVALSAFRHLERRWNLFFSIVTLHSRKDEHANTLSRMPSTHSRTFRLFRERSRGLFTIYDRVRHMPLPLFNTSRTLLLDPHPHRGSGSQTIRLWEKRPSFKMKGSNPKVFDQAFAEPYILGDPSALRADID